MRLPSGHPLPQSGARPSDRGGQQIGPAIWDFAGIQNAHVTRNIYKKSGGIVANLALSPVAFISAGSELSDAEYAEVDGVIGAQFASASDSFALLVEIKAPMDLTRVSSITSLI